MPLPSPINVEGQEPERHEQWLVDQGATIVGCRPLYQAVMNPMMSKALDESEHIEMQRILDQQKLYRIEASTSVVKRWKRQCDQVERAYEYSDQYANHMTHMGNYFSHQLQRHQQLLENNPMYRQAWEEFQQVRLLLGETTLWP